MAGEQVLKSYSPEKAAMLRKYGKSGSKSFYVVKSAEATRTGTVKQKPSRFKPARTK